MPNNKQAKNTNKLRFLLKQLFDFLYKKFTHWLITFYVSLFGCAVILVENKSPFVWFLSILFPVLFLTAIIYGTVEAVKGVITLIKGFIYAVFHPKEFYNKCKKVYLEKTPPQMKGFLTKAFFPFGLISFLIYFVIVKIITFLTRFYPFSILFRDRTFHSDNLHLRNMIKVVEFITFVKGRPFRVESASEDGYFSSCIGRFEKAKKRVSQKEIVEAIAKQFHTNLNEVFIRNMANGRKQIMIASKTAKDPLNFSKLPI